LTLYIHICNPVQSSYSLRIPLDNTSRPLFDKLPFLKQPYTLQKVKLPTGTATPWRTNTSALTAKGDYPPLLQP
jgi:hypothetical protein